MSPRFALHFVAWLSRRFPKMPGRWQLVRWLESHQREIAAFPPQDVHLTRNLRMRVDPRDENGRRVFVEGFDPRERLTRLFIDLLRPGDGVLDIGANVGYYSMVASHLVGPAGHVHAFEASPFVLPWLQNSVRLSGKNAANIHVHGVAVTDHCGETTFHAAAPEKTGFSSLRDLGDAAAARTTVPCTAIDALLDRLPRIRLVKMDIEGAELLALRGMTELIARDRPWFVCEVDDTFLRALGGTAKELFELFATRRYHISRVVEGGELVPAREAPCDRCNIVASPGVARVSSSDSRATDEAAHRASQTTPLQSCPEIAP